MGLISAIMGARTTGRYNSGPYAYSAAKTGNPNPDPALWEIMDQGHFKNGYVLKVHYPGCSNFEGVKIMVYRGKWEERAELDPHFRDAIDSPVARFKPDIEGWQWACFLAQCL